MGVKKFEEFESNGTENVNEEKTRQGYNRELYKQLDNVCENYSTHVELKDIEQLLIELSRKYADLK